MSQTDKKDTKDTKESETHKDKDEKKDEAKAEREKLLAAQKVIRLGDIAPDFTAVTKITINSISMSTLENHGEFYFLIQKILLLFVLLNLAE